MRTMDLLPGMPRQLDDGKRTLKVWARRSADFLLAAAARRELFAAVAEKGGAFEVTFRCSKAELEEIRAEFNSRSLA